MTWQHRNEFARQRAFRLSKGMFHVEHCNCTKYSPQKTYVTKSTVTASPQVTTGIFTTIYTMPHSLHFNRTITFKNRVVPRGTILHDTMILKCFNVHFHIANHALCGLFFASTLFHVEHVG